ncbi:MAG: hypothetical protein EOP49_43725 [Sphingobacteriales bacterium]|nr:MAG: hypothetical protein EOP49_43725 [Sphingobacteriales bacterium]
MKTNPGNPKRELLARILSGDTSAVKQAQSTTARRINYDDMTDQQLDAIIMRGGAPGLTDEQKERIFTLTPYPHYDFDKLTDEELNAIIKRCNEKV